MKDVDVDLGGGDVGVAEEFLDGANVVAGFKQMGGEAVPEGVATDRFGNACELHGSADGSLVRRFRACTEIHQRYPFAMSTVFDIENAVQKLSRKDLTTFRDWFLGFAAAAWDKQFEDDIAAGRLDALADDAIRDLREGRCTDL